MPKNTKKPLLKESTVRRMFKLANIESVGNGFLSERFTTEEQIEENVEEIVENEEEINEEAIEEEVQTQYQRQLGQGDTGLCHNGHTDDDGQQAEQEFQDPTPERGGLKSENSH